MGLTLSNLVGTLQSLFRINRATIDASALTAPRTVTLPDASLTVAGKDLAQTFSAAQTFPNTGLLVKDTDASHALALTPGSNLTANRTLTITTGDADRTVTLNGSTTLTGTNTGDVAATSTTEVLTGTDTTKTVTADALAALWEQGSDVASASTISLGEGGYFTITGTTTITDVDFATDKAGRHAWVRFSGALTLTHNATTLILPTGANITTAAGDTACFISEGSDVVRCVAYNRASGAALSGGGSGLTYSQTLAVVFLQQ